VPDIAVGEVVAYVERTDGTCVWTRLAMAKDNVKIYSAKVQSGWVNVTGDALRDISVKACDADNSDETGAAFTVKTPLCPGLLTNLAVGDVIWWEWTPEGLRVLVAPNIYDGWQGKVEMHCGTTATIRRKWLVMDGTTNSVANGGSGINMTTYYLKGLAGSGAADNTVYGDANHDHGGNARSAGSHNHDPGSDNLTGAAGEHSHTETDAGGHSHATETSEAAHPAEDTTGVPSSGTHVHAVVGDEDDPEVAPLSHSHWLGNDTDNHDHGISTSDAPDHDHEPLSTQADHQHAISAVAGHQHSISTDDYEPQNKRLHFIERII